MSRYLKAKLVTLLDMEKKGMRFIRKGRILVMTIDFEIEGQKFLALNGGPVFKFNEAISFQIHCDTQEEIDYYWENLLKVVIRMRRYADGSRTNLEFHGKLSLLF